MAHFSFAFSTLFHLSVIFFRQSFPLNGQLFIAAIIFFKRALVCFLLIRDLDIIRSSHQ